MTSFGDVNVGDKVRLTHRDGFTEARGRVGDLSEATTPRRFWLEVLGWVSEDAWSVEVLEPAPKPLPDIDGVYIVAGCDPADGPVVFVRYNGRWRDPKNTEQWNASKGLQRLVPESAVEEARAEVVKEIVKFLYRHDDRSWDVAANKVDLTFGGRHE